MIILLDIHNKQIDYTSAFMQAPFDEDDYISLLPIFTNGDKGMCWKLNRVIYGLKSAPRAFLNLVNGNWKILDFMS